MNILNEPEIIANIKQRYLKDIIFTYIGPTLIVMNPYKTIIGLFEELKGDDKPHIYSIANNAL